MRELNLINYSTKVKEIKDGKLLDKIEPYNVKEALIAILFMPGNNVTAREAFKRQILADKIEMSNGSILLEEAEWQKLVDAADKLNNVGRNDIEFLHRILDAPQIEVKKDEQ
uniref:Uncharacterized protein n=1 Tax=viral metagenome TaxID=1070528 RepID=A0A6M3LDZ5_9ZZZZ